MSPDKRELLLALALGLAAGPTFCVVGPERFLSWYGILLVAGSVFTAHWVRELKPSRAAWVTWVVSPVVSLVAAVASLGLGIIAWVALR